MAAAMKAKRKAEETGVTCRTIVLIGRQAREFIVREAKQKEITLIVMGTHGRTGLKKLLMGSVVQKVIAHAPCPVLIVPMPA